MKKNYYKILNLDFDASLPEVKSAYRRLALLYHPDKTDNELLKARFAEIKEAYEVLRDPVKRRQYDLTFDNFSYKKEEKATTYQLAQRVRQLQQKNARLDPHRMDLDRLEFEITELLSERNIDTLKAATEQDLVQVFVEELVEAARPLTPQQLQAVVAQLEPLADAKSREKMRRYLVAHRRENHWQKYKLLVAVAGGILLCLLIYFAARY